MKIVLPDNLSDITLRLYQSFMLLDKEADNYEELIFSLFTGIDIDDVKNVSKKDIDETLKHIYEGLQKEGDFKTRFTIDGIDFGFIPNFDKITGGEYSDLVSYSSNEVEGYNKDLNRLIAVLYRPITNTDKFKNYQIENYKGTSGHIEQINKLPMSIVNGVLGFFLTLSNDLETNIQAYMEEEQVRGLML
jgi:hypothetical protein